MERSGGAEPDPVIDDLIEHSYRFQFFQAVSLVRLAIGSSDDASAAETAAKLRFRATPSMGFPATDITGVTRVVAEDGQPRFEIEVPFLGLYGPSSPLPTFVTEHVIARDRDSSTLRDFLDLFNHRAIEIVYQIWRKYRHSATYRTGATDPISGYVFALMGMLSLRDADSPLSLESVLPFAGPMALAGRSAMLLETLVSHQFDGVPTRVEEFVQRHVMVDDAQRGRLGVANGTLGGDWVLGERVPDVMGKFRLWIGPVGLEGYRGFLPGRPNRQRLASLVDATIRSQLEYEVVLVVREDEVAPWRLGQSGELGYDAWLAGGDRVETVIRSAA
ncbi:hypothetical protein BAL199_09415 [alpha proteobacterium BAL199]|jgi:type VI secretion system protein ImpH|nr:hypothetical protein BAL199_09415 [alpha proteobacterium BAL199]